MTRKKVLDLCAGLGGRAYAFQKCGFDVVGALEPDKENCKILEEMCISSNIMNTSPFDVDVNMLPNADIITANYFQQSFSSIRNEIKNSVHSINYRIYEIIAQKSPQMFLIEVPVISITHRHEELEAYIQKFVEIGYKFSYVVYSDMNFSGYPVARKQGYLVGMKKLNGESFDFPKRIYTEAIKEVTYEGVEEKGSWYRIINFSTEGWQKDEWYVKTFKEIKRTNIIYMGGVHEQYLVDGIGPRRFTHNEMARLKGLDNFDFNNCTNKKRMYTKIAYESNVYVLQALAESIALCLAIEPQMQEELIDSTRQREKSKKKQEKIIFPKYHLKKIKINKIKGLSNLELEFEKNLIALMGVNGSGKSTILHALACTYSPYEKGENYKFSYFFTPNPDSSWNGSSFEVINYDENEGKDNTKKYEKKESRWARYATRPVRDVFYLGITTCIPEIEVEKKTSFINYVSNCAKGKHIDQIVADASYILQKEYDELMIHETSRKKYIGVHTKNGIVYSALSMGAGEQRIIKILQTVYNAHQYSLILIDEIDLLLHADAFRKLIKRLSQIAIQKHLQIIFTTHSLEMQELAEYVDIRYLDHQGGQTLVYNTIKPDLLYGLSGKIIRPYTIYVEDILAATVVNRVAKILHMKKYLNVVIYGAIENAFVVAAGKVLGGEKNDNILIITDGDKYISNEDKMKQMKKVLSGTEPEHEDKLERALSIITQFNLPEGVAPEKHIHSMLLKMDSTDECVECAKRIISVEDSHEWLGKIVEEMGGGEQVYNDIMEIVSEHEDWEKYVHDVKEWLEEKKRDITFEKFS